MYTTKAAHELIDHLHIQDAQYLAQAEKATDTYDRGLWQGYHDATQVYIEYAEGWLEKIEAEARLVPEDESGIEDSVLVQASRVVAEFFPTQSAEFDEFFGLDAA